MNYKLHENLNILITATNFPDRYYPYIAPWSKMQADSIYEAGVDIEVVAPRAYVIPLKGFPYNNFYKLPQYEKSNTGYIIHYPRFFYLIPKKPFFGITGNIYSKMVGKYILQNTRIDTIDIIHSRFVYLDGYGSIEVCKQFDIPLVADIHGFNDFGSFLDSKLLRKKQIETLNFLDKILCVAEWQIEAGVKRGISDDKLEYIPLGIESKKFEPRNKKELRVKYGIDDNIALVLFVGQLIERKGLIYLFSAIPNIVKSHKNAKFVIIGSGPIERFVKLCNEKDILQFVDFKGGIPENELLDYYWMSDIFILPSLAEGQPMVIYEAMASENAIIGTNVGGIPEQIQDGLNGFLIPSMDSISIAEKISYLLENPEICKSMGANSRKRIFDKGWIWNCYAERVIRVYKSLT